MVRLAYAVSIVVALASACACGNGGTGGGGGGGGGGSGSGAGSGEAADCEAARAHVADLYRAEATDKAVKDAAQVDQMVADNTAMVMGECGRDPRKVSACAAGAKSSHELEAKCLAPLDDEGTEGDKFK